MSNAFTKLGQFLGFQEEEGFEGIGGSLPFNLPLIFRHDDDFLMFDIIIGDNKNSTTNARCCCCSYVGIFA